jgi:hypothetical protein
MYVPGQAPLELPAEETRDQPVAPNKAHAKVARSKPAQVHVRAGTF